MHYDQLLAEAKAILTRNKRGGFTIPTDRLYPFQWNWDSAFVSIGMANYDTEAAIEEIRNLLSGQWENGMIPHIVFHSENEKTYFPNWDFWNVSVNSGAPANPKTSGISQPPVLGCALEKLYDVGSNDPNVIAAINEFYPKVIASHRWWYTYRDRDREGLVFIYHPWESGRDNSPVWDRALDSIDITSIDLPDYQRRDTAIADASERPTRRQYDQYVYLLELGKRFRYDGAEISENSEFLMQDVMLNAILIRANAALIRIGSELGLETSEIAEWQERASKTFNAKLWDTELSIYATYDLRNECLLPFKEVGGYAALYSGVVPDYRIELLVASLTDFHDRDYSLVPSFDVDHQLFDSKRYWRGPVWPQMNWLIYQGLKNTGRDELAAIVRNDFLDLVSRFGFREYFEARKSLSTLCDGGYGGDNFSWTASTVIDLILAE